MLCQGRQHTDNRRGTLMQDLTLGLLQFNQAWENPQKNQEKILALLKDKPKLDLLLLPEMVMTGFSMEAERLAENWEKSEAVGFLKNLSFLKGCAIYTSLLIKDKDQFWNRGIFVHEGKILAQYDKQHLFAMAGEDKVYSYGNGSVIVEFLGWKIALQICFDLRFPESARNSANPNFNYDLLLYVANWPEKRIIHWDKLLPARAIENQAFVAAVNRMGTDGNNISYCGHSNVFAAEGTPYFTISNDEESLLESTLNYESLSEIRRALPFLKERKK